ncbi:MAG: PilZ domain-containing protein [Myxococcota bacterium]|nr:PilZ domain-containing protein [Myxococcota bacterium]
MTTVAGSAEKRAHPRISMQQAASITTHAKTQPATVANLSRGGALVTNVPELQVGNGVRIAFRLPNGLPVHLNGQVVRRDGVRGFGVRFFELDDVTREALDEHLLTLTETAPPPPIDGELSVKYRLGVRGKHVTLTLAGYLEKNDCIELRSYVARELPRLPQPMILIIDALEFVCCAPDGVKDFTTWLADLPHASLVGGLVGPRSVGVLQLRRAIRDAHAADAFMAFDTVADAEDAFARLNA